MTPTLSRAGTPPRPRAALAVPPLAAVATVVLQVAYPLVEGPGRHRLTVAIVVVFAVASVSHAAVHRGVRFAVLLVAVGGGVGWAAELVGVATGWPFGSYHYTGELGPRVAGVPLTVALAWTMMAYPALVVARHLTGRAAVGVPLAGAALTAWDLFLDPQMVADGQWRWAVDGAYLGVPVSNYVGWLLTATVIAGPLWAAAERADRHHRAAGERSGAARRRGDAVPLALYVWTWAGSVVAHAAWLDLPLSAAVGGLGMGTMVAALLVAAHRR